MLLAGSCLHYRRSITDRNHAGGLEDGNDQLPLGELVTCCELVRSGLVALAVGGMTPGTRQTLVIREEDPAPGRIPVVSDCKAPVLLQADHADCAG